MKKQKLFFTAAIFSLLFFTNIYSQESQETDSYTDRMVEQASYFYQNGLYEKAERLYQEASKQDPENPEAWFGLGNVLFKKKKWNDAYQCFKTMIELNPTHAPGFMNTALSLLKQERTQEAIPYLEKSISLHLSPKAIALLCVLLQETERHEEALMYLRIALALSPGDSDILFKIGISLHALGQSAEALESFQNILKENPYHVPALIETAHIYTAQKRYARAIHLYKDTLRLKPDLKQVRRACASLLQAIGREEEIIDLYETILEKTSDYEAQKEDDFSNCSAPEELIDAMIILSLQKETTTDKKERKKIDKKQKEIFIKINQLRTLYHEFSTPQKLEELTEYLTDANKTLFENMQKKKKVSKQIEKTKKFKLFLKNEIKNLVQPLNQ